MAQTVQQTVEARLGVSIPDASNVVEVGDLGQYMQDGISEIYRGLQRQNAVDELRLFLGNSSILRTMVTVGCSSANPAVFASTGHYFQVGDYVKLNKFVQNASLNETVQKVATIATNSFTLENITTGVLETGPGGTAVKLNEFTDYETNPITGLESKFFNTGYVLVERAFSESDSTFSKEGMSLNYYACKEISIDNAHKATDPLSVDFATPRNPVYYRNSENGSITVLPAPSATNLVRVWGLKNFRAMPATASVATYSEFPDSYFQALIYYSTAQAAFAYVSNTAAQLRALAHGTSTTVTRLADTPPTIPYALANTITAAPPAFNKPTISPDYATLNAFLADDDAEMAQQVSTKISQELQQYAQDIQNEVGEWTDQFQRWQQQVAFEIQNADGDLQALLGQYQNEVARFQTNVQTYAQDIQQEASKVSNLIQKRSGEFTSFSNIATLYENKFQQFIMARMPAQQKGGNSAS